MARIPIAGPWITQKEIDYVTDAVSHAWYDQAGMYNQKFESAFAEYIGVPYAVSLPSCTSALHLALAALGIGEGDEVIVPDLTWIATSAPISYVGATPVFADIDPVSWCLSVESLEACLSPKTRAVISVDLYGGMPDYEPLRQFCQQHGLALIEDAAEAIGSTYKGIRAGCLGDVGTFSFHGSKTLTTGEGGMLVTASEDIWKRVQFLRDHGRIPGDKLFWNSEVAFKYKMSSLQAALGLAQLERIDDLVTRKREIFSWYQQSLAGLEGISLNAEPEGVSNSYWMVTVVLDPSGSLDKEALLAAFKQRGIDCRPFFYPLSSLPAYAELPQAQIAAKRNQHAYQISPYGINLPSALSLTQEDVEVVCQQLREILAD